MAKFAERNRAREKRRAGTSIKTIAKHLKVSPSSVSAWCKDIKLSPEQIEHLEAQHIKSGFAGRMKGAEMNRRKREDAIDNFKISGLKDIGQLSKRDIFMAGIGLYAGEGFKYCNKIGFCNSDPYIILLIVRWFKEICGITNDRFRFTIGINQSHKYRYGEVIAFWSGLLHIKKDRFSNPSFKKASSKKIYDNPEKHFGTLTVHIAKSSQEQYRIFGWMDALFGKT